MLGDNPMPQIDIRLAQLVISQLNSRKNLSAGQEDSGIAELAADIQRHGLLNPEGSRNDGGSGRCWRLFQASGKL